MYPTPDDPAYGAFVVTQMASIARLGHQVRTEFINGRRGKWEYLAAIMRVRRAASRGGCDVVHAHYGLSGFVASRQRHLPVVTSFCGDDLLGTPARHGGITLKSRVIKRLSQGAARAADAIICKSEQLRQALARETDRARAHVIANGVDTGRFTPGDRARARRALSVDPDIPLIVFPHTRGDIRKRVDLAEAAVARLVADGVGARLWVVNGVLHDDMPLRYQAADCLLLCSEWEGSPNAVKEALCCDLPVVSTDVGDVRHWIGLAPGCRVVAGEPGALAAALGEVLRGPRRVDGSRVRVELDIMTIAERVSSVYREAIGRAGRSRSKPPYSPA